MSSTQKIPVFVISLARIIKRREAICQHLTGLKIDFRLIDAVDGMEMGDSEIKSIVASNVEIHPGAIGCYLSHLRVYEIMKRENISIALVLEDDARINPDSVKILNQEILFSDWDYCFLDCDDHNNKGPVFYDTDSGQNVINGFTAYALSSGPQTTHSYMVSLQAALNRLEHAYPIKKSIDIYDHLPYSIKFYAIVSPKAAWVSEYSLESFTSPKHSSIQDLSFVSLRKWNIFYQLRDFFTFKTFKRNLLIKNLQSKGELSSDKNWKALPSGREILIR